MATNKGFIKDWAGNYILPITRGELVLDKDGNVALTSQYFLAGENGNQFGLITAAERAMLSGGEGTEGGITDIYNKLSYINNGLRVNGSVLNFYNSNGVSTPINMTSSGDGRINIIVGDSNVINFSLAEVAGAETTVTQILKGIKVDKFGRVTSVTSAALTNADIPAELSDKTLKNSILNGCVTSDKEIGTDEKTITNKAYVDKKFKEVTGIATGALKFGGPLNNATFAESALTNKDYWNNYFKVTDTFEIDPSDLYDATGIGTDPIKVKAGDTIIVYPENPSDTKAKFVYIPSGDDITTITVKTDTDTAIESKIGNVTLKFAAPFTAVNNPVNSNTAYISLPPASASASGYLTKEDWTRFNSYSTSLAVSYTGEFNSGIGVYKIGTLTIGTTDKDIYGKYNISSLTLENGTGANTTYNPILKFTETGATDVNITLKGAGGIVVKKNGNSVEFAAVNEVLEQAVPQPENPRNVKYLTIDNGYQFGVQIGSANADGSVAQDGLTDFSQFNALVNKVKVAASYEIIKESLTASANDEEYRYGNEKLKAAIRITI